eukprot:TRINITY_DN7017_c1_g1_i1.p1 TRINITY_DN7017_c1_g1~~TRINITY_DN7017_c1_g1_i1.p1  ORF type:complete len:511 (+),score=112.81 TRINITY_DN7017_c1_g1_i1:85-1617(+)
MPPATDWGEHVWTPRRHTRRSATVGFRQTVSPYDPQTIPEPPPERRLVAPAPRPPSASAPGLWDPRGTPEEQTKTMVDLLGVDNKGVHCGRFHFSPRRLKNAQHRVRAPYGHHPDHRAPCEAGLDMALIRDHDLPVPGDFSSGLQCTATRRSRSAPPPSETRHLLKFDDHITERSVQRQRNRVHGQGPASYAFNESPAAKKCAEVSLGGKQCVRQPGASERSILTGAGHRQPSCGEGLSVDTKGSSRRAPAPAPESQLRGSLDTPATKWRSTRRLLANDKPSDMRGMVEGRYHAGPGDGRGLTNSDYGRTLSSPGPGKRLYNSFYRSHSTGDLWGAMGPMPKRSSRRLNISGLDATTPRSARSPARSTGECPFDVSYTGGGADPMSQQQWRPWRRRLRSQSPGPVSAAQSNLHGHTIINELDPIPISMRTMSPRRAVSLGGSGVGWTDHAQPEQTRRGGRNCAMTPERQRCALSSLSGTGAVHDTTVLPSVRASPHRPRDSLHGAAAHLL